VAHFFRLRPFLLRRCNGDAQIGNVKGIGRLLIESGPEMGQSLVCIASTQVREAGAKFLKRFNLDHDGRLRLVRAFTGTLIKEARVRVRKRLLLRRTEEVQSPANYR